MLVLVACWLIVVGGSLCVVRPVPLSVVRYWLFAVVGCLMFVVCCLLFCCSLCVISCVLVGVCCFNVCCLLRAIVC